MEIISLMNNKKLLKEYIILCSKEWGLKKNKEEYDRYATNKLKKMQNKEYDKIISVLGLIEDEKLMGFISLFKYDEEERNDLTPWYATMYVKKEYRGMGYSKLLNEAILNEAKNLGYSKIYLKTNLINYYEKFGFIYETNLNNNEKLYFKNL